MKFSQLIETDAVNLDQMLTEGVIGDVISKVKNFFVKMFKKVYDFISKSFQNFLQFFGLTPEVKFNNNVEF